MAGDKVEENNFTPNKQKRISKLWNLYYGAVDNDLKLMQEESVHRKKKEIKKLELDECLIAIAEKRIHF